MKFEENYFKEIYAPGAAIDGDYNAKEHAQFLKAKFDLLEFKVKSIADFGCGKANLLYQLGKVFRPKDVYACDISKFAIQDLQKKSWSHNWELQNCKIKNARPSKDFYDLAICNSVIQYLPDNEVEASLKKMAQTCKFLYLHIPTAKDYQMLKKHIHFEDPYANIRTKAYYQKQIKKYFHFVSWGIVESKIHVQNYHQVFFDSLYRF